MRTTPHPRALAPAGRFLPPVLWMAAIAVGSSSLLGADRTASWALAVLGGLLPGASPTTLATVHVVLRKLGHLVEYGVLAVLWRRALAPSPRAVAGALAIAAAYAGLDELRQGLAPNRRPAAADVVLDAAGAALALAAWEGPGPLAAAACRTARWAAGGAAGLAAVGAGLEAALGRSPAALGATALGLAVAAVALGPVARVARRGAIRVSSGPRPPAPP